MGGNYTKGLYNQLMAVMEKLDSMEAEHKKDRKEITALTIEVKYLRKENASLKEEVSVVKKKAEALEEENNMLKKENRLLRDDNERMKRILDNNLCSVPIPFILRFSSSLLYYTAFFLSCVGSYLFFAYS